MAASAAEAAAGSSEPWWQILAPAPGQLELAARLALICALTVLVCEIYQTPEPAVTAYIVFFINRDNRTVSVAMNVALFILVTLIIACLLALARAVADDPVARVTAIVLVSFVFLFLTSASKLRPLGGTLALVVGFALDLLGQIQVGEEATRGLLYGWLLVGIPAAVSLVVNLLLAPAPRRLAEAALVRRLRVCATLLRGPQASAWWQLRRYLDEGTGAIMTHLRLAGAEGTQRARDLNALRQATASTWALMSAIDVLDSTEEASLPPLWRADVAQKVEDIASQIAAGRPPPEVELERAVAVGPLAQHLAGGIRDALTGFAQGTPAPANAQHGEKGGGFFVPDAFTNRTHLRYAVRTTGAALICYALYNVLDWPGIHTCFLTCYIVSQGTAAESVEKLLLRIMGCIIGSAAGVAAIVYLMPTMSTMTELMAVVFLGTLLSGYIAAGSPRISYAGFQIAFAFFLCILQGTGPALDLTVARDRTVGILIGNLVAYIALTRLWPVTIASRVDPAIAGHLRQLSRLPSSPDTGERRTLAAQVRAGLAAVSRDLELAIYEPRVLRPSLTWLSQRRAAVADAAALGSLLLLGCEQGVGLSAIAGRLQDAAARLDEGSIAPPSSPYVAQPASLQGLVNHHLHGLEQALAGSPEGLEILNEEKS